MDYDKQFNEHLKACFGDRHADWPDHVRQRFRNLWDLGRTFERSLTIEEAHAQKSADGLTKQLIEAMALMGVQNQQVATEMFKQATGPTKISTGIQSLDDLIDAPVQPCPDCNGTGDGSIPFEHSTLGQSCARCGGCGNV